MLVSGHHEPVDLGIVTIVPLCFFQQVDGLPVLSPVDHVAGHPDHRPLVGLVICEHLPVHGVGSVQVLQEIKRLRVIEGDALEVLPVILRRKGVGRMERIRRLPLLAHVLVHVALPPVERGIGDLALLGLVHLEGLVQVPERRSVLPLLPVKPDAQKQRLHVVRGVPELLIDEVHRLGLVVVLPEDVPRLLEVVVVGGLVLLGIGLAAGQGQQDGRQDDGEKLLHDA